MPDGKTDSDASQLRVHCRELTLDELQLRFDFRSPAHQQLGPLGIQLSAWHNQLQLASLIVMHQPGSTAAVCCVQQERSYDHSVSVSQRSEAISILLTASKQFAIDRQLMMIQCVIPACMRLDSEAAAEAEAAANIRNALQQSGFYHPTSIDQLLIPAPKRPHTLPNDDSLNSSTIKKLQLSDCCSRAHVLQQSWANSVLRLLSAVLESSQDLSVLPRPTAEELLLSWAAVKSTTSLLIANQPVDFSGLMVLSRDPLNAYAGRETLMVEYVGTHPAFRRRRTASQLLNSATAEIHCQQKTSEQRQLTAFVDHHNTAARMLYHQHGFEPVATSELWTIKVGASSQSLNAPPSSGGLPR